ncbi:hypothetical protein POTOM_015413 [Populus tomentosa]|uniref:Eukaryotic translation initiation factor 3 subunit J n=1 Tax=Populus tomentosa TaxID=118781 RepID=A0A8X8CX36_POPTO|nr:hypothetical protein POTOM_015413 [Populus tomentosa]
MEDWEDEQVPPLVAKDQPKSKWDDEDVDEDDVKESWEDEDEPDPLIMEMVDGDRTLGTLMQSVKSVHISWSYLFGSRGVGTWGGAPVVKPPPEMAPKKPAVKSTEKKGNTADVVKDQPLDPLAEKLRQQRLVEEADFRSTAELFGKKDDEKSLDSFIPKSESDFSEYAELISHKLRPFEKSYHYIHLLKTVMRLSMTSMKAADAKEVSTSVSAIANEKIKAEKEANTGKKKTGGKKKQLHVGKPGDDLAGDTYDALDDYDFM